MPGARQFLPGVCAGRAVVFSHADFLALMKEIKRFEAEGQKLKKKNNISTNTVPLGPSLGDIVNLGTK